MKAGFIMPHPPILIPEVGMGRETEAMQTILGCREIAKEIHTRQPQIVILITPHGPVFQDAICIHMKDQLQGSFARFGASQVRLHFHNHIGMAEKLAEGLELAGFPCVRNSGRYSTDLDHGTLVPLYFIHEAYRDFRLIHVTIGMLEPIELFESGKILSGILEREEPDVCVVASADLSHRLTPDAPAGYSVQGAEYDARVAACIREGLHRDLVMIPETLREQAGECGHRPISMLLGCVSDKKTKNRVHSYEGPFGVGYMNASLTIFQDGGNSYVRLARESISHYLTHKQEMDVPDGLEPEMYREKRGVFVTLKKGNSLRGCIGTFLPACPHIAGEIIRNAVSSATRDPRFAPVELHELKGLTISVDVLLPSRKVEKVSELDPKRYGVIVSKGLRRGLLLPNLEGVDTVEMQLAIALQKAGISQEEDYTMERFEVVRHK